MIIDLNSIDRNNFQVKEGVFCNEKAFLVTPNHIGTKFTQKNKIFRSSIWSEDGELLSGGLHKFMNVNQEPEEFPLPKNFNNTTCVEKCDGSCLLINKKNGILNCRTRGSFGIGHLLNSFEIDILKEKYPFAFDNPLLDQEDCTFVYEWVSPQNVIVIKYNEVDMYLLNIVKHSNYSYYKQEEVNKIAREYELKRPKTYFYFTLENLINDVQLWEGKEGVCLYHSGDKEITKIKAQIYLKLHALKGELNSEEKLIELFLDCGATNYNEFYNYIANNLDFEIAEYHKGNISNIADAYKEVNKILDHMKGFVLDLQGMSRKEQALKITSSYGLTNRGQFVFTLLDGNKLEKKQLKKLFFQVLK